MICWPPIDLHIHGEFTPGELFIPKDITQLNQESSVLLFPVINYTDSNQQRFTPGLPHLAANFCTFI
jgi:hypothetical protein